MGRLTTHVLDTARGKPAAGLPLYLAHVSEDQNRTVLIETTTNADGRTDRPLLEGAALQAGTYELAFYVETYFASTELPLSSPPFLDWITLRFTISDAKAHFHVPLLVSPWSYSTYRGS
jgi:hydroxyisourate hydrolase